jgi:mannobiose 2-epimerase
MAPDPERVRREYAPRLESNLREQVVDFWYPRSLDDEHGGYVLSYDAAGEFAGDDAKMIVTQARMVWFFATLSRHDAVEGEDEFLDAARQGYEFLAEEMWDDEHGGFYWEVARDGEPTKPNKHLYGQAFAIYGLAEYARAADDDAALELAHETFDALEREAHDDEHGGYVEYFTPDWDPITEGTTYLANIEPDWSPKESGETSLDPTMKLLNTHLHLLEAFTTLYDVGAREDVGDRLTELLFVNTNTVVRREFDACTDKYAQDWTPLLDEEEFRIVSYGHDVEGIWLVMEACDVLGVPPEFFRETFEAVYDYSLDHGYDDEHGGFYFFGPLGEDATNRVKAWWVQSEALVSALKMYEFTGDERYLDVFTETYDFVEEYQVDPEVGEWHSGVEDLEPVGRKGAAYKGAYHNGRALMECLSTLDDLT